MKKLFLTLTLIGVTLPSLAQHRHNGHWHYRHHHGYYGNNWVAPLIIGGVITHALTRPEPIIVQQPVIVQPPVQIPQGQNCTPWTETYSSDGTITRTRTCTQ